MAQNDSLPYRQIPAYPETFTAGGVASRMVDGLGFRFYWATEGLTSKDLAFKPGEKARTSEETIQHIYSMSFIILNATLKAPNVAGQDKKLPFVEMRKKTLQNLREASEILRKSSDEQLNEYDAIFQRGESTIKRPFWLLINGPISDCLWHIGQIVSFRRSSGNPFSDKVNVFTGTVME